MKLKFTYTPKKDSNGYYILLPNRIRKSFKTYKAFDRWFTSVINELNNALKDILLIYPHFSEFYVELYIRSNVHNSNRLTYIQKNNEILILASRVFGVIPNRGFYEAYIDINKLINLFNELCYCYEEEFIIFSDRYVLNKLRLIRSLLEILKFKIENL